jgi:hypothetical protein
MAIRVPCSQCGRNSFHEENGLIYCDGGHQQEDGPRLEEDDGDFGVAGKVSRKKDVKGDRKLSKGMLERIGCNGRKTRLLRTLC